MYLLPKILATNEWRCDVTVDAVGPITITFPVQTLFCYFNDVPGGDPDFHSIATVFDGLLEAAFTAPDETFTVTYDVNTGKFTIACSTGNITIDWVTGTYGTGLRNWLGFTGSSTGSAASHTSTNVARGVIFASSGRTNFAQTPLESVGTSNRAQSGLVAGLSAVNPLASAVEEMEYEHQHEPRDQGGSPYASGTWDVNASFTPWTWADAWLHLSQNRGLPLRVYTETSSSWTLAGYYKTPFQTGAFVPQEEWYKRFAPANRFKNFDGVWVVPMKLYAFVKPTL